MLEIHFQRLQKLILSTDCLVKQICYYSEKKNCFFYIIIATTILSMITDNYYLITACNIHIMLVFLITF